MDFWGVEVEAGTQVKVEPQQGFVIHLSQAALGESKKKAESVFLYAETNGKKMCLGSLFDQKIPQLSFDLIFESEFHLSHTWKHGSVFFCGYKAEFPLGGDELSSEDEEEEEEIPSAVAEEEKPKPDNENAKPNVKAVEPSNDETSDEDDSSYTDTSDDDISVSDGSLEFMTSSGSEPDESDKEEEEDTPVKAEVIKKDEGKKRKTESATKTPEVKKTKAATPEKTDGKKSVHIATPHPAKGKSAAQTSKSGGQSKNNSSKKHGRK